ncbi:MAG: hypothetical protein ACREO1_03615 [Arenimonas sp.]
MIEISFLLLFVMSLLAMAKWRWGFALCVLMAILQGPIRKLAPDQPVYFVMFVAVVFAAMLFGAFMKRVPLLPRSIAGWRENVATPFNLFLMLILIQAAHSLFTLESFVITGIGLLSYLAPIPAIVLAYQFALRQGIEGVRRWMRFYVVVATLAIATVYLEYLGFDWSLLGQVGSDMLISYGDSQYKGNSGIFRATEIAAWHAATIACFSFLLFLGKRFTVSRIILALLFIAFLVGLGALTGRRKMIIQVAIFLSTYIGLITWFRRGNGKLAVLAFVIGIISYIGVAGWLAPDPGDAKYAALSNSYVAENNTNIISHRTQTVFAEIPGRIKRLGVEPISWAVEEAGWLGAGVGVGSQGAQHFGAKGSGAAEGGLGKFTLELGVPGLILFVWLFTAFARYVWRLLAFISHNAPAYATLAYGLVSFILANVAAFSVATQAYGDVFILLTLGLSLGFLLALPTLSQMHAQSKPNSDHMRS